VVREAADNVISQASIRHPVILGKITPTTEEEMMRVARPFGQCLRKGGAISQWEHYF
jgi:hypothetical protein